MKISKLPARFKVEKPGRFRLDDFDPAETAGFSKADAKKIVADHNERLTDLQERLYAEDSWAVLIILFDFFVIWALTAHGRDVTVVNDR